MSTGTVQRVGILGGTFDPVHRGHLAVAVAARARLGLATVTFVPAASPPHKGKGMLAEGRHRLAMVRLAISRQRWLVVSSIEFDRRGPSYTIDTVREFLRRLGASTEIFFLIGADTVGELPAWKDIRELARLCTFAPVTRPGADAEDLSLLDGVIDSDRIRAIRDSVVLMEGIDISSTEIRRRIGAGEPIRDLIPPAVERYIRQHRLYC